MKNSLLPLFLLILFLFSQCKEDEPEAPPTPPDSSLPQVVTTEVDSVTNISAVIGVNITSPGSSAVLLKGVCYGTAPNPDLTGESIVEDGFSDEFTSSVTGLIPGTEYFVRAYGVNDSGVSYGNELSFSTLALPTLVDEFASSSPSVNFSTGEQIFFTAEFNFAINWTIEIIGQESGAVIIINGNSLNVNESNSVWDGSASATAIFKAEQCEVKLSSPDDPAIEETLQINVLGPKPLGGDLITDFEQDLGSSLFIGDFELELTDAGLVQDENAIQGSSYLYMEGTDNSSGGPTDNFFVGLVRLLPSLEGNTYFSVPSIEPSQLYLNLLVFNELPNSRLVVSFKVDSNDNGQYDDGTDQFFSFQYDGILNSPSGWNDLNFSMEEMGVSGNEISKILAIEFVLVSLNNLQPSPREPVGFGLDYLSFSVGEPLDF